jgi:hypothetical protein
MKTKTTQPITIDKLQKEILSLKKNIGKINKNNNELTQMLETIMFKSRNDVPIIFATSDDKEIFRSFNLKSIPKLGSVINLTPTEHSCCLNAYLMKEHNLNESELERTIENNTSFSFIISNIITNITIVDSHPTNEWEDFTGVNHEDDDSNFNYRIVIEPYNVLHKKVLIEKI